MRRPGGNCLPPARDVDHARGARKALSTLQGAHHGQMAHDLLHTRQDGILTEHSWP
jgi:hypothetical protein